MLGSGNFSQVLAPRPPTGGGGQAGSKRDSKPPTAALGDAGAAVLDPWNHARREHRRPSGKSLPLPLSAMAGAPPPGGVVMGTSQFVTRLSLVHYELIHKRLGSSHVVYWVDVEAADGAGSWTVKRRFSEFVELQKLLQKRFKGCDFPSIASSSVDTEHRRDRLDAFLRYLSRFEEFLRCVAVRVWCWCWHWCSPGTGAGAFAGAGAGAFAGALAGSNSGRLRSVGLAHSMRGVSTGVNLLPPPPHPPTRTAGRSRRAPSSPTNPTAWRPQSSSQPRFPTW